MPIQVSSLSGVIGVAGGYYHSLALKSDGTVWAWGWNGYGQLGDGTTTIRKTPVQVSGLSGIIDMAGGVGHGLALRSDGTVWAWGRNSDGQLGDGTGTERWTPVQVSNLNVKLPSVSTGTATSVTTNSATLNGTVTAFGATTAWFDYGTVSGVYTGTSTTQRSEEHT